MQAAGCEREVFNSDALALLHEQAQGRLREVDRACVDALRLAARRKLRFVDRDLIVAVLGDIAERDEDLNHPRTRPHWTKLDGHLALTPRLMR